MQVAQSPETISDPLLRMSFGCYSGGSTTAWGGGLNVSPSTDDRHTVFFQARRSTLFFFAATILHFGGSALTFRRWLIPFGSLRHRCVLAFSRCGVSLYCLSKTVCGPQCLSPALVRSTYFAGPSGVAYMFLKSLSATLQHCGLAIPTYGFYRCTAGPMAASVVRNIFQTRSRHVNLLAFSISVARADADCTSPESVPYLIYRHYQHANRILLAHFLPRSDWSPDGNGFARGALPMCWNRNLSAGHGMGPMKRCLFGHWLGTAMMVSMECGFATNFVDWLLALHAEQPCKSDYASNPR